TRRCAGGSHRARTVQLRDCAGACVRRERRRPSWKERTECSRGTADTGKPEVRSRKSEVQVRARGTGPTALTFELPASNFFGPQTSDFRLDHFFWPEPSATTRTLRFVVTSRWSFTGTVYSPSFLIGSGSCSLRRSSSKPLVASASVMSPLVTEP